MVTDRNFEQGGDGLSGLVALMYVSVSMIEARISDREVATIVARSAENNAALHISGALIFTSTHFAQVLEGNADEVDRLMAKITADPRHRLVTIVERGPIAVRRFAAWSMAYKGAATYIDRPIRRLLPNGSGWSRPEDVHEIHAMMHEFTRP